MTEQLSRPARQFAAIALLALALGLLALVTVLPLAAHVATLHEQIESERALLGRFMQIADKESEAMEYERIGRAAQSSGAYLKGESEALTAAGLQTILAEIAATHQLRFRSTRALPARERGEARFVGVRVQFNAEIEQVRAFLHRIEVSRPFLFVEAMQIQPVSPYSQRDPAQAGVLDVGLDVFGAIPGKKG
jgi:Type II secretion system (T2SS), protein M subtype b